MSDLKSRLTTAHFATEDVTIDGVGTIKVRALTRAEVLDQRKALKGIKSAEEAAGKALDGDWELWMLSTAMVDPVMTPDDVRAWQQASSAGEIERVTEVISRLSGIGKTIDPKTGSEDSAEKAAYKSVPA